MSVRMPSRAKPDVSPCRYCGKPKLVHYHTDGSYRAVSHDGPCPNHPPGPPSPPGPQIAKGLHFPDSEHEREVGALKAQVAYYRGQMVQLRYHLLCELGLELHDAHEAARRIPEPS